MDIASLKTEEDALRKKIALLSAEHKKIYYQAEKSQVKDPDTYAALNWCFPAGLHHFYLGKTSRGIANLLIMLMGLIFIASFGLWLILVVFIIELPQLFKSQVIVYQYNNEVMKSILAEIHRKKDKPEHTTAITEDK